MKRQISMTAEPTEDLGEKQMNIPNIFRKFGGLLVGALFLLSVGLILKILFPELHGEVQDALAVCIAMLLIILAVATFYALRERIKKSKR